MIVHSLSWTAASSANQEATGPDRGSRESVDDVDEDDGDGGDDDGDDNDDSDDDGDDTDQRVRSRWGLGWWQLWSLSYVVANADGWEDDDASLNLLAPLSPSWGCGRSVLRRLELDKSNP